MQQTVFEDDIHEETQEYGKKEHLIRDEESKVFDPSLDIFA